MEQKNKDVTLFAQTNFRGKEVPFGIKTDDRRRHMYLVGKTGMGKTSVMENMIIQDIQNGNGVAFVDPHGDSVEKILNYIPSSRVNDVIYINPADLSYPIAFNILESVEASYKHLVASGLMGVFTKIWANTWSSRMEYILNNTILALLDSPGNTLLGISRIFLDKKYRKKIVDNVKDPMVRAFWVDEYANWQEKYRMEAVAPIQNKVGQFLSSGIIRNIVGQPRSTIDLRQIMDEKKILLMNLSKGRVGEDNSALLGAMIITKLQLAALSRVDIPETDRNDFYLYVDEFQNFATESFATILSEARKYRLCLTIGHQYIGQLVQDKNTKVRDAVFGNVGTTVTFRIGAADAEFLEKEFAPNFTENDLVNLPKYNVILKLMINGVSSDPFTAETLPPTFFQSTGNMEKVVRVSRERYANPVAEVEDKIMRWMGEQDVHDQVAILAQSARSETQSQRDDEEEKPGQALPAVAAKPVEPESKALSQAAEMIEETSEREAAEEIADEAPKNHLELQEKLESPNPFDAVMASQYVNPLPVEPLFEAPEPPKPQVRYVPQKNNNANRDNNSRDRNNRHGSGGNSGSNNFKKRNNNSNQHPVWESVGKMQSTPKQPASANIVNKLDEVFGKPKNTRNEPRRNQNNYQSHSGKSRNHSQKVVLKPGESHKIEREE